MIIFLDEKSRTINIYGEKGRRIIQFEDADEIEYEIGKSKVLYVTNAKQVSGSDVVDLVNRLSGKETTADLKDTVYYLQSRATGPVFISDLNITFMGPDDGKEIDKSLHDKIMNSVAVQSLLKKDELAIVPRRAMVRFIERYRRSKSQKRSATTSAQDKQLDDILIDSSVKAEDAVTGNDGMFPSDGIETIDITDEVKRAD
jgi:hypothetical protein